MGELVQGHTGRWARPQQKGIKGLPEGQAPVTGEDAHLKEPSVRHNLHPTQHSPVPGVNIRGLGIALSCGSCPHTDTHTKRDIRHRCYRPCRSLSHRSEAKGRINRRLPQPQSDHSMRHISTGTEPPSMPQAPQLPGSHRPCPPGPSGPQAGSIPAPRPPAALRPALPPCPTSCHPFSRLVPPITVGRSGRAGSTPKPRTQLAPS